MVIRRGQIWWAELSKPVGAGPGYRRPVVIIQSDSFNQSCISTVMAAVITSNTALALAPGNVLLSKKEFGLSKESVVNISQIITIDKTLLSEQVGVLSTKVMKKVEAGLRLGLSL